MKRVKREFPFKKWPRTLNDLREALGYDRFSEDRLSERENRWVRIFAPSYGERAWAIIAEDVAIYTKDLAGVISASTFPKDAVLYELRVLGNNPEAMTYGEITKNKRRVSGRMALDWLRDLERTVLRLRKETSELRELVYNHDIKCPMNLPSAESSSEREDTCFINDAVFERKDAPEQEDK